MDFLYSLYDALVSINVPSDKARAVVDAMERDMGTTLATKQDLLLLAGREDLAATRQDLRLLATREELLALKQELLALKQELRLLATKEELLATKQELGRLATREELLLVKQDLAVLRQEMESRFNLLTHEIATQGLRTTVWLGSMLVVGFGLAIAAMRLWI